MRIAFCTTCKGRRQHVERTLPKNIADNPDALNVLLSYNDQDGLAEYIRAKHSADLESGRLAFYEYKEPVRFRMAHAKNMVHRLAMMERADVLVNMDADNFAGEGFAEHVAAEFKRADKPIFLWPRMVKDGAGRLPKGICGRIVVLNQTFVLAGGYDERYTTHSPDDKDFDYRIRQLGHERVEIPARFLNAILHNDKMRFREYPAAALAAHGEEADVAPSTAVVNGGRIGLGVVYRNFDPQPVRIRPLPTRIFGIGMHKTATTSLHHALLTLGFSSAHWQTAPWAKRVWREVTQNGRSSALEQFYSACDLPIPLVYRELDAAYPGSKFVLTMRDEWSWLKSVHNHWSADHNPHRWQWDQDVFTHRCHNLLYGRKDFDATTMLARYQQHNAEVREHFKHRPGDLLVLDLDKGHGWPELCRFLSVPVPAEPYPHKLKTKAA